MLSALHLLGVCVCRGLPLTPTPAPSPAEIIQQELMICGASSGQLASLPAIVHQEAGLSSQACSCSSAGSQQNAQHRGGATGYCRDHWVIADHWIPGSEGTAVCPSTDSSQPLCKGTLGTEVLWHKRQATDPDQSQVVHLSSSDIQRGQYPSKLQLFFVKSMTGRRGDPERFLPVLT